MPDIALSIDRLSISFSVAGRTVQAVRDVSLEIPSGQTLALVGESGSGKSITGRAAMRLLPATARATGRILVNGRDVLAADEQALRRIRGSDIAMVFQDSLSALSPYLTVGEQIIQAVRFHDATVSKARAFERAVEMLDRVGIPEPRHRAKQYPHEFSGGMRQRAVIAMALVNEPAVLIADEPTTALDVTVQAQILDLMRRLQQEMGMAMLLITHDFGVVAKAADRVLVLYAGEEVETGSLRDIFEQPAHPYTAGLRAATPRLDRGAPRRRLVAIPGVPTSLPDAPDGCSFAPRCSFKGLVGDRCHDEAPIAVPREGSDPVVAHRAACHLSDLPVKEGAR
ncbi:ABC transporter ATP-binding protein [Leifsonia sp. YAF41]|uniref:ABC transporter ATP-binding protein n=1 Tax=Leifsonia sp. YAF41 TaxID=3233086 RepID=UPI003F9A76EC